MRVPGSTRLLTLLCLLLLNGNFVLALTVVNDESPPPAFIVYGGLEPLRFTNIFPVWEQDETVTRLAMVVRETVSLLIMHRSVNRSEHINVAS